MIGKLIGYMAIAVTLSGAAAFSETSEPGLPHGLLWRNSPLAAVFPLVVKTPQGRDFYLKVEDAKSGEAVLAAGITGGRFFRVLVPNGRFVLDFTYGTDWRGEADGFALGPKTGALKIETPLTFGVQGVSRKGGHVVILTGIEGEFIVALKDQVVCQGARQVDQSPLRQLPALGDENIAAFPPEARPRPDDFYPTYSYDRWSYVCK